jgi:hypothetical protein
MVLNILTMFSLRHENFSLSSLEKLILSGVLGYCSAVALKMMQSLSSHLGWNIIFEP